MGRSRRRNRASGARPAARRAATAPVVAPTERRRTLAAYLAGALVLAVAVLLGTLMLAGALAPWLVLIVVTAGAAALHRWAGAALAEMPLTEEDRVLQTMAGGLLVLVVGFAVLAAIALSVKSL